MRWFPLVFPHLPGSFGILTCFLCKGSSFSKYAWGNCSTDKMNVFKKENWLKRTFEVPSRDRRSKQFGDRGRTGTSSDNKYKSWCLMKCLDRYDSILTFSERIHCLLFFSSSGFEVLTCLQSAWAFCFGRSQCRHIFPSVVRRRI